MSSAKKFKRGEKNFAVSVVKKGSEGENVGVHLKTKRVPHASCDTLSQKTIHEIIISRSKKMRLQKFCSWYFAMQPFACVCGTNLLIVSRQKN